MPTIVTLITDFGLTDYYVGSIKGAILSKNNDVNIVDVTHHINNYDIVQAAFVLKNIYTDFPAGTIHIVNVDNGFNAQKRFLVIYHKEQYFIGPDNGIFSLVFNPLPTTIFSIDYNNKISFPVKYIFADAIQHILSKKTLENIGKPIKSIIQRISLQPVISTTQIRGTVIHIDNYGNVVVNIPRVLFESVRNERQFSLYFKRYDPIVNLSIDYMAVPVGETLCLFNSADYLEIAINMGKASSMLGLKIDDTIQIDFYN